MFPSIYPDEQREEIAEWECSYIFPATARLELAPYNKQVAGDSQGQSLVALLIFSLLMSQV